jgi:hypothetical protein
MEYGEEPRSVADKGIGLKATWNDNTLARPYGLMLGIVLRRTQRII